MLCINANFPAYLGSSFCIFQSDYSFSRICICKTSCYKFELGNKTTISNLSVQQKNYHPVGAVDDPMNWASGNSSSGHSQYLVGDSFDCCTERYEIVV